MAIRIFRAGKGFLRPWVLLAVALSAACAAPQFNYAADSSAHAYFKVPHAWHKIDDASLWAALNSGNSSSQNGKNGLWTVGYDADPRPSAAHVLNGDTSQPFVFAVVRPLSSSESSAMSYDGLRDFFLPVTSTGRQNASQSGYPLTRFQLLNDSVLAPGQGVHGVRDTFDYTFPDGSTDTFDQIALMNADATEVYLLLIHCQSDCYSRHQSEINTVMTSFTVRSQ
ncbi:MAG: hypothetical protein ACM3ML_29655 [Micromonosporaceae bacterium]